MGKSLFFMHGIAVAKLLCRKSGTIQVFVSVSATPQNFLPVKVIHKTFPPRNISSLWYIVQLAVLWL